MTRCSRWRWAPTPSASSSSPVAAPDRPAGRLRHHTTIATRDPHRRGVPQRVAPARVVELAHKSGVKAVQLHGHETAEQCIEVGKQIRWVIKAFSSDDREPASRRSVRHRPDHARRRRARLGQGVRLVARRRRTRLGAADPGRWSHRRQRGRRGRRGASRGGSTLSSGVERAPGTKDALAVKRFIENARAAAAVPYLGDDDAMPYDWDIE